MPSDVEYLSSKVYIKRKSHGINLTVIKNQKKQYNILNMQENCKNLFENAKPILH